MSPSPRRSSRSSIETSGYYHPLNPSKLGLSLNLATPEARRIIEDLVRVSDAVVESFTPRVLEGWGLGYDDLKKIRPDLVMLSLSMAGRTGCGLCGTSALESAIRPVRQGAPAGRSTSPSPAAWA